MSAPTHLQHRTGPLNPANARWQARRRRLIGYGQWQPFMDAQPVRDHLRKIMAEGMPLAAICEQLGLPHTSSLQHLFYGRGTHGPGHQVRRETAELILAYWPTLDDFPDGARIDPTGTRRRVQALGVRGWPRHWMATQIGMSETSFKKALHKERVTARIARGVAALYDECWNRDPLAYGLLAKSVDRVKADAARAGWYGPLAWDDDTIDDPQAVPVTDAGEPDGEDVDQVAVTRFVRGFRVGDLTDAEFLEAMRQCVALGMSLAEVDQLRRWPRRTTENRVNRLRKQYERGGRPFPSLAQPGARSFSEAEVVAMRERSAAGATDVQLAMSYDVTRETVRAIVTGQRYAQYGGPVRERRSAQSVQASREYMCGHGDRSVAARTKNEMGEAA